MTLPRSCRLLLSLFRPDSSELVPAPRIILKELASTLWCNLCNECLSGCGVGFVYRLLYCWLCQDQAYCCSQRCSLYFLPPSLSSPVPPLISSVHGSASRVHLVLYIGVLGRRSFCFIGPVCFFCSLISSAFVRGRYLHSSHTDFLSLSSVTAVIFNLFEIRFHPFSFMAPTCFVYIFFKDSIR